MKKIVLFATLVTLVFLGGCKKEQAIVNDDQNLNALKSFSTQQEAINYTADNLKIIGESLLSLTDISTFRSQCYTWMDTHFDGDNDVLFETIHDNYTNNNNDYATLVNQRLSSKYSSSALSTAYQAFNNIEGENYYPQLFIPYYEELKSDNIIGTMPPILVIFPIDDPNVLSYTGYQLVNGSIEELPFLIDDNYASKHEVWVMSLSERVDNNGELRSTSLKNTTSTKNCKIEKMKVKQHKESWAGGKSEVNMRSTLQYYNGLCEGTGEPCDVIGLMYSSYATGNNIRDFTRSEVNNQTEITMNFQIEDNWPYSDFNTDEIIMVYAIFEQDNWPTGIKTDMVPLAIPNAYIYPKYRSADQSYITGRLFVNTDNGNFSPYAGNFVCDNTSIKFNTLLY